VRWPHPFRRRQDEAALDGFTSGVWAKVASPEVSEPVQVVEPHVVVKSAGAAHPPPEPVLVEPPVSAPGGAGTDASAEVRLGFNDGTAVDLDPADPRAIALRAVAEVLVAREDECSP
jgi:hypothetical protein